MSDEKKGKKGMATFGVICFGQMISIFGSAMTQFGLMIWAWDQTGQATALALIGFFAFAPQILMAPIAGALVDRWNRKTTIILSDLAAGMGTVAALILYSSGMLEIWHLYIIAAVVGAFGSFQFPAYSAAITMLVDKSNYERATAIWGLAFAVGGGILGPAMAVLMLTLVGISGVLTFDIVTFTFAIGLMLLIKIPEPERAKDIGRGIKGLFKDAGYGFKYIFKRKPLLGLQLTYFSSNFFGNMSMILLAPMILAVTASNEMTLATIMAGLGAGSLTGGIILALWGGSKTHKIIVIMTGIVFEGVCQIFFGLSTTVIMWTTIAFILAMSGPFVFGSSQAIWQRKVPANRQGRVFAARGVIAMSAGAFGMVLAGPLADLIFEPGMMEGGNLAMTFGWLLGTGPGTGIKLIMILCGIGSAITAMVALSIHRIRNVETLVLDADEPEAILEVYKDDIMMAYKARKITKDEMQSLYKKKKEKVYLGVSKDEPKEESD